MREIRTSGLTSGDGKRGVAAWPKPPRPSLTLPPDGRVAEEAFAVIRDAMREKQVVGIGRVVLYRRERPIMLEPRGKGLVARTLRYAYEVREDREDFEDVGEVAVGDEMLDLATHIIARKLSRFDPQRFEDRYQNALIKLIKAKTGHRPAPKHEALKPSNVVNLMDALRKSIAAEKAEEKPAAKKPPARAKSDAAESRPTPASKRSNARLKKAG